VCVAPRRRTAPPKQLTSALEHAVLVVGADDFVQRRGEKILVAHYADYKAQNATVVANGNGNEETGSTSL
jgi:hypothetical protein